QELAAHVAQVLRAVHRRPAGVDPGPARVDRLERHHGAPPRVVEVDGRDRHADDSGRSPTPRRPRTGSEGREGDRYLWAPMATPNLPDKPTLDGLEERWGAVWEQQGTYRFDRTRERPEVFSIDTPP